MLEEKSTGDIVCRPERDLCSQRYVVYVFAIPLSLKHINLGLALLSKIVAKPPFFIPTKWNSIFLIVYKD